MPEEVTPDTGNTTEPTATQIDWESADNPYVQRYREAQSHLTPVQQENARLKALESDPEAFLELGKKQGWIEFDEPAPDPTVDPRLAQTQQELAEMRQWRDQVESERQSERVAAGEELFHTDLDTWAEKDGVKLSKADHNAIFGMLMRAPDPTQESAAREVYEAHIGHKKAEREQWEQEYAEARKRPRVPTTPANGKVATGTKPFHEMSRDERDQWVLDRMQDG